jgi:hypothetical protein
MRIKEWSIVMTCSLQYLCSTREWLAIRSFYSLDQLKSTEIGEGDIRCETFEISDDKRTLLHLSSFSTTPCASDVRSGNREDL